MHACTRCTDLFRFYKYTFAQSVKVKSSHFSVEMYLKYGKGSTVDWTQWLTHVTYDIPIVETKLTIY